MPKPSDRQRRQRELAWALFQVLGARGNLYPRHRSQLPDAIYKRLQSLCRELEEIEKLIRGCLAHDAQTRSFILDSKPQSTKRSLHDDYDPCDFA
jgi:hypothetical protein